MTSIRETSMAYESPTTKVISELGNFNTEMDLQVFEGNDKNGDPFSYNFVVVNEQRYRVPNSVLMQVKTNLEDDSGIVEFKVKKTGSGLNTTYTVIPVK